MTTDKAAPSPEDVVHAAASAVDQGQKVVADAIAKAEKTIAEAAKSAEKALKDGFETLRSQAGPYAANAGQSMDEAQKFVVDHVKERPVTAALAGLGAGLLIGLLLASRDR